MSAEECMWKLRPDWVDSMEDSTEGNGSVPGSGGGGVSAFCNGDAANEWKCDVVVVFGGNEERLVTGGDCGICPMLAAVQIFI